MPPPPLRAERERARREAEETRHHGRVRSLPSPGARQRAALYQQLLRSSRQPITPPPPREGGLVEPTERLVANPDLRILSTAFRHPDGRWGIDVQALDGELPVGHLWADEKTVGEIERALAHAEDPFDVEGIEECLGNLEQVSREVGKPLVPFVVRSTDLEEVYQGRGYGIALYRAAALAAAKRGGALLPHLCMGGETSEEALRVWFGGRFAEAMKGSGFVFYAGS